MWSCFLLGTQADPYLVGSFVTESTLFFNLIYMIYNKLNSLHLQIRDIYHSFQRKTISLEGKLCWYISLLYVYGGKYIETMVYLVMIFIFFISN